MGFSRRNKIPCCSAYDNGENNPVHPDYNPDRAQKLISSSMSRHLSTRNISHLGTEPSTHAYSAWACHLDRLEWVPGESWGSKRAYRVTHQPGSVVWQRGADASLNGLTSGGQRRLTGNGSALDACSRRCGIQMAAFTLLFAAFWCCESAALTVIRRVYLCVCVSVTFVHSVKTNKHIFNFFSPSGSHTIPNACTPF